MTKTTVNEDSQLEVWYGKDYFGKDVEITDYDLLRFLNDMARVDNVEGHDHVLFKNLLEHALKEDFVQLHDGTRLVRRCSAAKEQDWVDVYGVLSETIKTQN